jgi:hypothetical protein
MPTVTLDTNLVDDEQLLAAAQVAGFEVAHTTVTDRELSRSGVTAAGDRKAGIIETGVVGESIVGMFVVGSRGDQTLFDDLLEIISDGSFPRGENRKQLSRGQKRQVRDAMIFSAHVRDKREMFITNDQKGFILNGRRERLEQRFGTRIYTATEFLDVCRDATKENNV